MKVSMRFAGFDTVEHINKKCEIFKSKEFVADLNLPEDLRMNIESAMDRGFIPIFTMELVEEPKDPAEVIPLRVVKDERS